MQVDRVLPVDVGDHVQSVGRGHASVGEHGHTQARLPRVRLSVQRLVRVRVGVRVGVRVRGRVGGWG